MMHKKVIEYMGLPVGIAVPEDGAVHSHLSSTARLAA